MAFQRSKVCFCLVFHDVAFHLLECWKRVQSTRSNEKAWRIYSSRPCYCNPKTRFTSLAADLLFSWLTAIHLCLKKASSAAAVAITCNRSWEWLDNDQHGPMAAKRSGRDTQGNHFKYDCILTHQIWQNIIILNSKLIETLPSIFMTQMRCNIFCKECVHQTSWRLANNLSQMLAIAFQKMAKSIGRSRKDQWQNGGRHLCLLTFFTFVLLFVLLLRDIRRSSATFLWTCCLVGPVLWIWAGIVTNPFGEVNVVIWYDTSWSSNKYVVPFYFY